jgi:hypothetical protein
MPKTPAALDAEVFEDREIVPQLGGPFPPQAFAPRLEAQLEDALRLRRHQGASRGSSMNCGAGFDDARNNSSIIATLKHISQY